MLRTLGLYVSAALAMTLCGCGRSGQSPGGTAPTFSPPTWAQKVAAAQSLFDAGKPVVASALAIGRASPAQVAKVTADQVAIDAAFVQLAASPPASATAITSLVAQFVADIPPGVLSPTLQAEINAGLIAAEALAAFAPASATP
jgi:hypothetical protein